MWSGGNCACSRSLAPAIRLRHSAIPLERVGQLHLAGYDDQAHADVRLDTHSQPVSDDTWSLYRTVLKRIGRTSALVEWDVEVPSLERLLDEQRSAQALMDDICTSAKAG